VIWATGQDIPFVPNKRFGGVTLGGKIAPIFFNTQEDSGALPIEVDVTDAGNGRRDRHLPYDGKIGRNGETVAEFQLQERGAAGRSARRRPHQPDHRPLAHRPRRASSWACPPSTALPPAASRRQLRRRASRWRRRWSAAPAACPKARACARAPTASRSMTTVGSQDTTGPMTRDELKDLACLGFSADLVMQSFCHTAAYPKPVDVKTHRELPDLHSQPRRRVACARATA
jgi:aconitate hydratase 2/2-methylisocitrate dehydratase